MYTSGAIKAIFPPRSVSTVLYGRLSLLSLSARQQPKSVITNVGHTS